MVLATANEPTATFHQRLFTIALFDGKRSPLASALAFAGQHHKASLMHLISPPSSDTQPGFQKIVTNPKTYELAADGILITSTRPVGIWSRDCPIVIIMDTVRGEAVVCHAGRPAMTPHQHLGNRNYTIVTAGIEALTSRGSLASTLSVYITGAICRRCFTHDLVKDVALLTPFTSRHAWAVDVETGALDLVGIIQAELVALKVLPDNITYDGLCTKEHEGLASKRNGDDPSKSNLVVVIPHHP